jgi:hypothetical protein
MKEMEFTDAPATKDSLGRDEAQKNFYGYIYIPPRNKAYCKSYIL